MYEAYQKEWRVKNRDRIRKYQREYYIKNKGRILERQKRGDKRRRYYLLSTYGITLEQYESMRIEQNHKCLICGNKKELYIDHDHKTGKIRGLLCDQCNRRVGNVENNTKEFIKILEYLGVRENTLCVP